jgi:DNA-binding NarL/FixJ family response regulator
MAKSERKPARKIFVVEDHPVVRFGFSTLINNETDMAVCGEESSASAAMAAIRELNPDLVVADLKLTDSSGLQLVREIKRQKPSIPVLIVSESDETFAAEPALEAGAMGYLMKVESLDSLIVAIRQILSGQIYISEKMTAMLLNRQIHWGVKSLGHQAIPFTQRETEVLSLMGQWKKEGEITKAMHITPSTLYYFRSQLKKKLGLRTIGELTLYATTWLKSQSNQTGGD